MLPRACRENKRQGCPSDQLVNVLHGQAPCEVRFIGDVGQEMTLSEDWIELEPVFG